ncbi:tribbles homolog 2-like [Salminus brasiliensis]|uniref:tribbles homolog 2-like n=1 Tax=Salminus brasiliensis TaxID=930266 RepID=UPI003B8345F2
MPSHRSTEAHGCLKRVGEYVLFEKIGQSVFRATHIHSDQKLVCKVFPISRYLQSVAVYLYLPDHPNLTQITDIVVEDMMAYVFFGQSYGYLHTYVQTSRSLDEDEASALFHQMVSAVAHCHSNDVLLRDLKLRRFVFKNQERTSLMLTSLEDASVMDKWDDSVYGKHRCPVYYASPEGLLAEGKYSGKAADVWSLGVMLYTILVGRYPFSDSNSSVLFRKIQRCRFSLPEFLSPKARCLIQSILRLDPSERLTAQEILDHPWFSSPNSQKVWRSMFLQDDDQMVPELCSYEPVN